MNIVADESVDAQIVGRLRAGGRNVQYVAELDPGIDDDVVLFKGQEAAAVLLTADKDFGDLVFRQRLLHSGVVLIRLAGMEPERKADVVSRAFAQHHREMYGSFSVLSPGALRIRQVRPGSNK